MRSQIRRLRYRGPLFVVASITLLLCAGCPDSIPVTVKVQGTDCLVNDLKITFTALQSNSGGLRHLKIHAHATCKGQPLNGATLIFTVPGDPSKWTATTGGSGDVAIDEKTPNNNDLIDKKVSLSVDGDDGKSYPRPPDIKITQEP